MNRRHAIGVCSVSIGVAAGCVSSRKKQPLHDTRTQGTGRFDSDQRELLTLLADTVIPATDTPSASAAGVVSFIEKIVFEWLPNEERDDFLMGLRGFMASVERLKTQPFDQLSAAQRTEALLLFGARQPKPQRDLEAATSFYNRMRSLTIYGYYTSEAGATRELRYNLATGQYEPCHPLDSDERAPALDRLNFKLPAVR